MSTTTLVLLPGLDGTEIFFAPLIRHLPEWIRPVVVSYPTTGPNDYEHLIERVSDQVSALGPFAVMGWSFGGPLALRLASRRPADVEAMILCGSFVTSPKPWLAPFRFAVRGPLVATVRAIRRTRLLLPGQSTGELRRAKAVTWRRVDAAVLARRSRAALGVDARDQLRECRVPILYLASTRDEVVGPASLREVVRIAPSTRVAELEGPHFALFTNPAAAAGQIAGFLRPGQTGLPLSELR